MVVDSSYFKMFGLFQQRTKHSFLVARRIRRTLKKLLMINKMKASITSKSLWLLWLGLHTWYNRILQREVICVLWY